MIAISEIRDLLANVEALSGVAAALGPDEDLFARGLDSFGSVQLMLALEERFGIEFPDHLLNRRSFSTLRIIQETVSSLHAGADA